MCATFSNDDVGKSVVTANDEPVGVVASVEGDVAHVRPETDVVDSAKSSIGWEGVAGDTRPLDSDAVREITDDAIRLAGDMPSVDEHDIESAVDANTGGDATDQRTEPAGGSAGTEETEIAEDLRDETGEETLEETDAIDESRTNEDSGGANESDGREATRESERGSDRGLEADPTELAREERASGTRTDASVDPDADLERTDAAVDPTEATERTDAAVDSDDEFESTDAAVDLTGEHDEDADDDLRSN